MESAINLAFDIFLSYKSEDSDWVNNLKESLQKRGVRVWVDKDEIRPGDLFVEALENALDTSKTVGLVVTPQSLESKWVREEYYRAITLSRNRNLQLIPLLLKDAELPGFLSSRHYIDFRDESNYELNVDRLIFPGITGKKIILFAINSLGSIPWITLTTILHELNVEIRVSDYVESASLEIDKYLNSNYRVVAIADIFEGWPWNSLATRGPNVYVRHIFEIREKTKSTKNEVVFILYQNENALKKIAPSILDTESIKRLSHYFTIPMIFDDSSRIEQMNQTQPEFIALRKAVRNVWIRVQRELLRGE
jgi:hypothetical protein